MLENINIHFVSLDTNLPEHCKNIFSKYSNITYSVGNIQNCNSHDCIVSPANSFGQMDGGIDAALSYMLQKDYDVDHIGRKVRKVIAEEYSGEQPIGTCILVKTENPKFPFLAHAPTMTIPQNVNRTLNAYYAFKAVLEAINFHNKTSTNKIKSILTTTFCTGCGEMSLEQSLKQMRYAYDVVNNPIGDDWADANEHVIKLGELVA